MWDNIAETALSHKERDALQGQPLSLLKNAAKNLRLTDSDKDIGRGSELAEILLYGIMKHKYGALPVVPKIFYKQNTQDNAKGADSVHIILDETDGFTLWFGEAKLYTSIEDARLDSIIQSVKNSLATDKLKKENSIIVNLSDIDLLNIGADRKEEIKSSLSNKNSIDKLKPLINIPIFLLHEYKITASTDELTEKYVNSIKQYHKNRAISYFSKQIKSLRDCLGTLFRNSLTVGSLKKINNLFIKDIFHGYCLKRQSLTGLNWDLSSLSRLRDCLFRQFL